MNEKTNSKLRFCIDKVMDYPALVTIFLPIFFIFVIGKGVVSHLHFSEVIGNIVMILIAMLLFAAFRIFYKNSLPTERASAKVVVKGILLGWPLLILPAIGLIFSIFLAGSGQVELSLSLGYIAKSLLIALEAGICEELIFRGIPFANMMRVNKDQKHIIKYVILSSLLFGGIHLINLTAGAGLAATLSQVVAGLGMGMTFAALYFRCGSILPGIILHTITDFAAFLSAAFSAGADAESIGILQSSGNPVNEIFKAIIMVAIFGGYALFLLRKKKREGVVIHAL